MFKRRKPEDVQPDSASGLPGAPGEGLPAGMAGRPDPTGVSQRPADSGLGVPPFRPVPAKDVNPMSRPPFGVPAGVAPVGPQVAPGAGVARPASAVPGRPAPAPAERRTLVVGRGITVQGTVQDAERLVVEGTVEASEIRATELAISPGGMFKGEVKVEDAEVAGTIDGTLTANGNLVVRATGRVIGTARCRRLQVEDGGQLSGRVEMITDATAAAAMAADPTDAD